MATFGPFTFDTLGSSDESEFVFTTSRDGATGVAAANTTARWCHDVDETVSSGVGPIGGEGGNPDGYVYTEASAPGAAGDTYTVEFNRDLNGNEASTIQFYLSARGTVTTSQVEVQISEDGGAFSTITGGTILVSTFATATSSGTAPWTEFNFDLGAQTSADIFRVRLVVTIQGNPSWHCDIGLDSITVTGELPEGVNRLDGWTAGPVSGADFSFPVSAGDDRCIVLAISAEGVAGTVAINSATYGGVSMTPVDDQISAGGTVGIGTRIFILDEAGIASAVGTTVSVSYTDITADQVQPFIASYQDVDQASITVDDNNATSGDDGGDTPSYTVDTADKGIIIAVAGSGNFDEVITWASPLIKQAQTDATSSTGSVGEVMTDGTTVTVDPSFTNVNRSTSSAVSLRPASGLNPVALSGTVAGSSSASGDVQVTKDLSGTVPSTSGSSGDLSVAKTVSGTLSGSTSASGNATLTKALSGTSISTSTLSGNLDLEVGDVVYGNKTQVNDGADSTDKTITFSHDNDGEDLLIVAMCFSNTSNAATVTSTATYNGVSASSVAVNPDGLQDDIPRIEFFFLEGAASGSNTVECTFNAEDQNLSGFQVYVFSLSGITSVGPVVVEADNGDTTTTTFSRDLDVQEAGSDIFAVAAIQNGSFSSQSITPGSGYKARTDDTNSGGGGSTNFMARAFSLTVDGTGNRAVDATFQTADTPSLVAVEFITAAPAILLGATMPGTSAASGNATISKALSGSVPSSSGASGSLQVDKALSGSMPGVSGSSGVLSVDKALSGSMPGVSGASGNLQLDKPLSGSIPGVSGASGNVSTSDLLSGSISGVSGSSGSLQVDKVLSGTVVGASGASGNVSTTDELSGSVPGVSGASGNLQLDKPLSGSMPGVSGSSGNLSTADALSGSMSGVSGSSGNLAVSKDLSGSVPGVSGSSGNLQLDKPLSGSMSGTSGVSGNISTADALSGTVAGVSGASGNLARDINLSGDLAGTSDLNAALQGDKALFGTVAGVSGASGNLSTADALSGSVPGTSATNANLQVDKALSGSMSGTSDVSGDLQRGKDLSGTVEGASGASGSLGTDKGLSGSLDGTSDVSGNVQRDVDLSGAVSGSSGVSGTLRIERNLSGTVGGSSALSGDLQTDDEVSGSIDGVSDTGGNISVQRNLSGSVQGSSGSSSNLLVSKFLSGTVGSQSTVSGDLTSEDRLSGSVAGGSGVSGSIDVQRNLSGSVAGSSELNGSVLGEKSLSGTLVAASDGTTGNLSILKLVSGRLSGSSETSADLILERDLQGGVDGTSGISGQVSLNRNLSGGITAEARIIGGLAGKEQEFLNVSAVIGSGETIVSSVVDDETVSADIVNENNRTSIQQSNIQAKVLG